MRSNTFVLHARCSKTSCISSLDGGNAGFASSEIARYEFISNSNVISRYVRRKRADRLWKED